MKKRPRHLSRLAVVHIAKKETGMTEEEYRALLAGVGVDSSKDLKGWQFDRVMARFEALGFRTTSTRRRKAKGLPGGKADTVRKIEAIILDMGLSWAYVDSIAKKRFGVDAVQWLEYEDLRKVLQMMIIHQKRRKGATACSG
jgi:phage gp16-like protein